MSLQWHFSAFPEGTFSSIFGRAAPSMVEEFLRVVQWAAVADAGSSFDPDAGRRIAQHALTVGIDYGVLNEIEAGYMDALVLLAFSPEGADALGLAELDSGRIDGPSHTWAQYAARASRRGGFLVLPWLEQGRRWGTTQKCGDVWSAHLVLSPGEAQVMSDELNDVARRDFVDPEDRQQLKDDVLPQLTDVIERGLELVGISA